MVVCIDAGATLTKVIHDDGVKEILRSKDLDLHGYIKQIKEKEIRITGGKSFLLPERIGEKKIEKFDEFNVISDTIGKRYGGLAVTVGTGTSMIDTKNRRHCGGTGIGGGTIMGLCSLIYGAKNFEDYDALAMKGNRKRVDIMVKEIIGREMGMLNMEMTASNLAKNGEEKDIAASIFNMVGEVVGTIASLAFKSCSLNQIVFLGSTLRSSIVKDTIKKVCKIYGCPCFFVNDPVFEIVGGLKESYL